jgi:hypothetical protein
MALYEQIIAIYPELIENNKIDFFSDGTIVLQNDSDGNGDYIKTWNHPTLMQPTQEQLIATNK